MSDENVISIQPPLDEERLVDGAATVLEAIRGAGAKLGERKSDSAVIVMSAVVIWLVDTLGARDAALTVIDDVLSGAAHRRVSAASPKGAA